jgi:hypothetical protein
VYKQKGGGEPQGNAAAKNGKKKKGKEEKTKTKTRQR